jgi:hypothetical protein
MIWKVLRETDTWNQLAGRTKSYWMRISFNVSLKMAEADVISYPTHPAHKRTAAHLVPFYLREHSKRILRGALYNDSKFLSDINVMDYSLVVGVDSQKNELVVGIVGK